LVACKVRNPVFSFLASRFKLWRIPMPINVEIKARCANPEHVRNVLKKSGARRVGLDHQVDTYFSVPKGRLKLRQGTIETNLIHYHRKDGHSPKTSRVHLYQPADPSRLHDLLADALGIRATVRKHREIFFHRNVKFHIDQLDLLGSFVEIEVIADADPDASRQDDATGADESAMYQICREWMRRLDIDEGDLLPQSYCDMIMETG
jgi:adenylate cyclase class 2